MTYDFKHSHYSIALNGKDEQALYWNLFDKQDPDIIEKELFSRIHFFIDSINLYSFSIKSNDWIYAFKYLILKNPLNKNILKLKEMMGPLFLYYIRANHDDIEWFYTLDLNIEQINTIEYVLPRNQSTLNSIWFKSPSVLTSNYIKSFKSVLLFLFKYPELNQHKTFYIQYIGLCIYHKKQNTQFYNEYKAEFLKHKKEIQKLIKHDVFQSIDYNELTEKKFVDLIDWSQFN